MSDGGRHFDQLRRERRHRFERVQSILDAKARRKRYCPTGKVRYRSAEEAARALDRVTRKRGPRGELVQIECASYPCPHCGRWHLTSRKGNGHGRGQA